jgi:hypothetical protein
MSKHWQFLRIHYSLFLRTKNCIKNPEIITSTQIKSPECITCGGKKEGGSSSIWKLLHCFHLCLTIYSHLTPHDFLLPLSNMPQISLGFKHFLLLDSIAMYLNSYPTSTAEYYESPHVCASVQKGL